MEFTRQYRYSGTGTDVAARVGEVVSGVSRNRLLETCLAQPLQMESTFYSTAEGVEQRNLELPTRFVLDKATGKIRLRKFQIRTPKDGLYTATGGSVISTAPDLARWLLMIRAKGRLASGQRYLSPQAYQTLLSPMPNRGVARGGLFVRSRDDQGNPIAFGHNGSSGTSVLIDLQADVIVIVLTQTPSEFNQRLRQAILEIAEAMVR